MSFLTPPVGLCVSLLRTQTADEATELVESLIAMKHPRVVALSVDGNEAAAGRTGPRFAEAFRRAGAAGLRRTVHAGESSGPEGVWDAVELLGASLVGEYALCRQTFGWNDQITQAVARTSIEASFANEDIQAKLLLALKDW